MSITRYCIFIFFLIGAFHVQILSGSTTRAFNNWQYQVDSLQQAFFQKPKEPKKHIQQLFKLARAANKKSLPAALYAYNAALHVADSFRLMPGYIDILTRKAITYQARKNYSEALRTYYRGIQEIDRAKGELWMQETGWFFTELGNLFYKMELYPEAEKNYRQALENFHKKGGTSGLDVAYNNIGLCKAHNGEIDSALHYFNKGLQFRQKYGNHSLVAHSYLYFAQIYFNSEQLDSSDSYLRKAQAILEENKHLKNKYQRDIHLLYADVLFEQGKPYRSLANLRRALHFEPTEIPRVMQEAIYNQMAKNFLAIAKQDSAKEYAFRVIHSADSNTLGQRETAFQILQQLYQQMGMPDSAYYYANKRIEVSNLRKKKQQENFIDFYKTQIQLLQTSINNEKLLLQSKLQEKNLRFERNISLAILAFLILLGAALYIIYRQRRKAAVQQYHYRRLYQSIQLASEQSSNILLLIGIEGQIEFINDKARNLFEIYDNTSLQIGDSFLEKLKEEATREYWAAALNKAHTLQSWQTEKTFNAQGKKVHTLLSFMPLDYHGKFNGLVMVGIDTTQQKLQNERLTAQAKDLEKANRSKEKIISVLAHDLKEGIYSSHALGEIVLDNAGEQTRESLLEYTELINQNLVKTKYLLEEVMDWVRNQGDDMKPKPIIFDIQQTLFSIKEHFYKQTERKGIELTLKVPSPLKVNADPNMIRSVLYNLTSNAIKFSPPLKGRVNIYYRKNEKSITLYVEDNGQGLTPDETLQIKRRQGVNTRPGTDGEKGTGVGLQLVMDLLALNQSKLQVESIPQQGTTFYFSLPAG